MPSPYPGLRPFHEDEAHLFFGREAQIEDMLARLEDRRFLAVVGTSGCGKSSLVRAGLIPALEQGFLSEALPNWRIAVMRPGSAPFDNLTTTLLSEAALGPERQSATQAAALLQATLRRGPLGFVEAVAESQLPEGTNLLLVVDQFEELFRYRKQSKNINDADAFVSLLLKSAQSGQSEVPLYVVITMRSDFIGDCALFTGLPETINDSQFLTPRLTRDQYREAIVEPALVAGGQLTDALVNRLLNDLRGEPDQLPVLQHALMRMWTQAGDDAPARALTVDDYEAVGGLTGALSKHCDEILYNDLNPEQQRLAEAMFRALCERSSEQRDTRRPAKLGEIAAIAGVDVAAMIPVVDAFRGSGRNFLMPPLPVPLDVETTLDISHESLIRQWPTLNTWAVAEAESAHQYQRLEDDAKRRQQKAADLWRGVNLENARLWKERQRPTEAWAARYGDAYQLAMDFLTESEAEKEKQRHELERARRHELEQARSASRLKTIIGTIGTLVVVVIVAFVIYAVIMRANIDKVRTATVLHEARSLSAASQSFIEDQPTLSILLSIEALKSLEGFKEKGNKKAINAAFVPAAEETLRKAVTKIAGTALVGHEGAVNDIALSPDGQIIATASADDTVRLWPLDNPEAEPRILRGHRGRVHRVAFNPDGQVLATASADHMVRLWPLDNPKAEPRILRGHTDSVLGVAFHPKDQVLATASADDTVRLWALDNPKAEPRILRGHTRRVHRVAFSPNGQVLATASADKTVRLWSLDNPKAEPRILQGHTDSVLGVAFSPDGQVLATASADKTVRLWSLDNPQAEPRILWGHTDSVLGVAFSPDGQVLATASADKTVRLWALDKPEVEPRILRGHTDSVLGVAFSPDGQVLATASADHTVRLWSLDKPEVEPRILRGHTEPVHGVAFSPDGQVLATASADGMIRLWVARQPMAEPRILRGHSIRSMAWPSARMGRCWRQRVVTA